MSVERWRMSSGRVASVDLSGHPDAVQGARELLRMNGATRIDYAEPVQAFAGDEYDEARAQRARQKDALEAGGNQPEGTKTSPEGKDPLTTVQPTVAKIRQHLAQRGTTVDELAAAIGAAPAALAAELEGERLMLDTFGRIADALGLSMAEMA